jgi:hypothetical protein
MQQGLFLLPELAVLETRVVRRVFEALALYSAFD